MGVRWYICNPALLPHGLTRHSGWLPQYPDMFMDLPRAVQRSEPKETTYMKRKTREEGSKSKREPRNRGGVKRRQQWREECRPFWKRTTDGTRVEMGDIMETAGDAGLSEGEINKDRDRKLSGGMESGENNKCSPTKRVSESAANEDALPETSQQEKRKAIISRHSEGGGESSEDVLTRDISETAFLTLSMLLFL